MKIFVTVKPGSSQEKVVETGKNDEAHEVTIWTHARAHDGEANKKVIELLSDFYGVPKSSVRFIRGEKSKIKTFEI